MAGGTDDAGVPADTKLEGGMVDEGGTDHASEVSLLREKVENERLVGPEGLSEGGGD